MMCVDCLHILQKRAKLHAHTRFTKRNDFILAFLSMNHKNNFMSFAASFFIRRRCKNMQCNIGIFLLVRWLVNLVYNKLKIIFAYICSNLNYVTCCTFLKEYVKCGSVIRSLFVLLF